MAGKHTKLKHILLRSGCFIYEEIISIKKYSWAANEVVGRRVREIQILQPIFEFITTLILSHMNTETADVVSVRGTVELDCFWLTVGTVNQHHHWSTPSPPPAAEGMAGGGGGGEL